jgi:hypothetical protein
MVQNIRRVILRAEWLSYHESSYTQKYIFNNNITAAKAVPLQAWTGPEESRRVRL